MECVPAILIRSTAITHKHSLNDPLTKHMISLLHLLVTGNQYPQKEKKQFPKSDAGNVLFMRVMFAGILEALLGLNSSVFLDKYIFVLFAQKLQEQIYY